MSLYFSDELDSIIGSELSEATESVQVVSAFCKRNAFNFICNQVSNVVKEKKLLVRFRLSDIVSGASDIDIYDLCKENHWELYIKLDLHAKTLVFDRKRALLGSANVTSSGLMLGGVGNCELSTIIELNEQDLKKINMMFDNSVMVTDELYERLKSEISDGSVNGQKISWSESVLDILQGEITTLFSYELPDMPSYSDYEGKAIQFLELPADASIEEMKIAFCHSNGYKWLKKLLSENGNEMYYGAVSAALHNAIMNDPKPYRKDVKIYLSNMLNWIIELDIKEIVIDRPNYSQRIRLNRGQETYE